jgi:hypothetical protein
MGESIALLAKLGRQAGWSFAKHPEDRAADAMIRAIAKFTPRTIWDQPKEIP